MRVSSCDVARGKENAALTGIYQTFARLNKRPLDEITAGRTDTDWSHPSTRRGRLAPSLIRCASILWRQEGGRSPLTLRYVSLNLMRSPSKPRMSQAVTTTGGPSVRG